VPADTVHRQRRIDSRDRKTYAGQAKAQRTKGFERIDVTFDEVKRNDAQA
jgi:hypothetical protein